MSKAAVSILEPSQTTSAAISLAASVVRLTHFVYLVGRDVAEKKEAEKLIAVGEINAKLFETFPLMSAYYICCAPHSLLVNTIFDRPFDGMTVRLVEHAIKNNVNPLRASARALISAHRVHIPKLKLYPGVVEGITSGATVKLQQLKHSLGAGHMAGGDRNAFKDTQFFLPNDEITWEDNPMFDGNTVNPMFGETY